jgi:CPA1 family monovalent cation:H+ antiporter
MRQGSPDITSLFWLLLIAFVVAIMARRLRVPYALTLVVTGLVIGAPRLLPHVRLEPQTLMTVFLPPLLFESAINLRIEPLRREWRPIAIYAVIGTIVSTFLVGGLTASVLGIPLRAALVFGALISATDPISVLAVFKRLRADRRLTLIVEAESLFNDGVAVVLFRMLLAAVVGVGATHASPLQGFGQFVQTVAGGIAVGAGIGALASRVHGGLDDHLVEITLTSVAAYGAMLAAEALHVSGVIAVVAAGLVVGNYGMQSSMSASTRLAVAAFWEYAAFVVNSLVFLLVGIEASLLNWWQNIGLALGAVGAVLVGRASIYPLSFLVNRLRGNVPLRWQHVLFWGGLRGALSMALVLGLGQAFPHRDKLVAATFGVVLFSLLVQGLTIGPLLRRLGLTEMRTKESEYHRLASEGLAVEAALRELERLWTTEAYPNWAIKTLTEQYQARRAALEQAVQGLGLSPETLEEARAIEGQRLALLAEKSALYEAARRGWLDEEEWRQLVARIDDELTALTMEGDENPAV